MSKLHASLYDPYKTFKDNFDNGPFPDTKETQPFKDSGKPKFSFLGHKIYSPFGIPAGPLLNSKHIKYAFERGFDVICYKTQRSIVFPCNEFPNVLFLDIKGDLTLEKAKEPIIGKDKTSFTADKISITNSFGNPSRGPEFWLEDLKKAISYQSQGQLLIMSVVGTIQEGFSPDDYYDDFASTADLAVKAGAKVIELNLSCPNVASEGVLCYSHDSVISICKKTKAKVGNVPIVAKLGYFSSDQQQLLESIIIDSCPFVSAFSVINTIPAPIVDENGKQALPGPNRLISGVCGHSVSWAGKDMVKRLKAIRDNNKLSFEIIGVGGVMNANDFKAYRKTGADVVQSATGAIWNPNLAAEVKASL